MELQIQDLVSSIKRDGIEEAEKQKASIIEAANAQAQQIISSAKAEAARLSESTRRELELEKESQISATRQACRDVVISLKKELNGLLQGILAEKIGKTMDSKTIGTIVIAALQNEDPGAYELQAGNIDKELKSTLAEQISKGLKLSALPGIEGFKLVSKDGSGFYDFSDGELARIIQPFIGNLSI